MPGDFEDYQEVTRGQLSAFPFYLLLSNQASGTPPGMASPGICLRDFIALNVIKARHFVGDPVEVIVSEAFKVADEFLRQSQDK